VDRCAYRLVIGAAAVMVAVFVSFAFGNDRGIKLFGTAMASAVFLDAIVIRSVLMPAVLQLFGRRTWAFPTWLDRRLVARESAELSRAGFGGYQLIRWSRYRS
jgi:RND superfamily putative drug exporter